jgi:hypothetical protein
MTMIYLQQRRYESECIFIIIGWLVGGAGAQHGDELLVCVQITPNNYWDT